ncbi:glucagon family neuropeptides-like [Syngnathoides biaculeatus]|uniref:glucagon family neuropeptides-like n=1 Tax=Syngnathoides biaculeatus TaxID=300417 RepID=UPI002ADD954E|nr:glucagon family neuropeptides-like [Syngnathoides biaculeatus]
MFGGGRREATERRPPQDDDEGRGRGARLALSGAGGLVRRKMSRRAALALLIYGMVVQRAAGSGSHVALGFPAVTLDGEVYDVDGNSLPSLDYDRQQLEVRSPPAGADDVYSLYYPPPDKR